MDVSTEQYISGNDGIDNDIAFTKLQHYRHKYNIIFDKTDIPYISIITAIFNGNNPPNDNNDPKINDYYGLYHTDITKNYDEAIKYFMVSINAGNSNSMNNIASLYGEIGNDKEAVKYYMMAINAGNTDCIGDLGFYYEEDGKYEEALKYYMMGVNVSNGYTINMLGDYYMKKNDYVNAEKYYLMAINLGDSHAMDSLADYYYKIRGDHEKAVKYYKMAINAGDIYATHDLAYYYMDNGNYGEAIKYFTMGVNIGNDIAINGLADCYKVNGNHDEAMKYYIMAANAGNINAMRSLADYYKKNGNHEDAMKYYAMAITNCDDIDDIYDIYVYDTNDIYGNSNEIISQYWLYIYCQSDIEIKRKIINRCNFEDIAKFELRKSLYGHESGSCYICLDENKPVISWPCHESHSVCYTCYPQARKINKCGMCRANIMNN